jgi:four helix bundle protein
VKREMKIKNFKDLDIWALGKNIVLETYKITKGFPKEEMYGLTSQMRRTAVSVPSNIAEGFNRRHNKEYAQFLFIALGSCAELETHIEVSYDLGYLNNEFHRKILESLDHESRMIRNLIKKL